MQSSLVDAIEARAQVLIDLRSKGVNGSKAEAVCEMASIVLNKPLGWVKEVPKPFQFRDMLSTRILSPVGFEVYSLFVKGF